MKKGLIMLLLLVAIVGSFGMSQAAPPDGGACSGVIDLECKWDDDNNPETAAVDCFLYVDLTADDPSGALVVICENPPAA